MMLQINSLSQYQDEYRRSIEHPEQFWAEQAEHFEWHRKWHTVLKNDFITPDVRWFEGGRLNITENCLDRHIADKGDKPAIIWEPNDPTGPSISISYRQLLAQVNQCANALRSMGVSKGDRICIYMPMIPQAVVAMLACARVGAVHSIVFAGFSAKSLSDRITDTGCKWVICSDYNRRGAKDIAVKEVVDEALSLEPNLVEKVLVYKHTNKTTCWNPELDVCWQDIVPLMPEKCAPEIMDSGDMLFILYTSGSTGKPKGAVHTIGGYMVFTCFTFINTFQYKNDDIYWCTADIGWITGHSYGVYGPLLAGATTLMFEGVPNYPDAGRFWQIIDKYRVTQFYTAPTAIRSLMASAWDEPDKYKLDSLKVIGSVGEPINEEAWHWYDEKVGRGKVPIVDTWWQTENGGIMITPLPGITDTKPCYASYPLPGVQPVIFNQDGKILEGNDVEGLLCIRFPWPSVVRTTYGDHERCRTTYFAPFPGFYFTGDAARRDSEGRYRIMGRVDDVINVSGHRLGTAEVEDAINSHPEIVESAVVGFPHPIKGQGIYAYVTALHDVEDKEKLIREVLQVVTEQIGAIAKPDKIQFAPQLPKNRSGKIMRRILRKIAEGAPEQIGDTSTLINPECVQDLIDGCEL